MKLFFSEFLADYSKYHFPYQVWLLKEPGDDVNKIYDHGFLPIRNMPNVFYLSRNIRVDLAEFEPSSENRRVLRKTEEFSSKILPLSDFNYTVQVQKLCKDYAEARMGKDVFPASAVKNVFLGGVYNYVFVFEDKEEKPVGYAVCYISDEILQYAHSFYDLKFFSGNLGARMMLEAVMWAKENNRKFVYLGTCYEDKSLYKTEFKGVEFFNGLGWSKNLEELKALIKRKAPNYLLRDKDYLETFHQGDLHTLMDNFGVRVIFGDELV